MYEQDIFIERARIKLPSRKQPGKEAEYEGIISFVYV